MSRNRTHDAKMPTFKSIRKMRGNSKQLEKVITDCEHLFYSMIDENRHLDMKKERDEQRKRAIQFMRRAKYADKLYMGINN